MDLKEAAKNRHTVRKFLEQKISSNTIELLSLRADKLNKTFDLELKFVEDSADALSFMARKFFSNGVNYYFILAGKKAVDLDEKIGYAGADLMLYAQSLGLNTWWIGSTFSVQGAGKDLSSKHLEVRSILVLGYGYGKSKAHKSKKPEQIYSYKGNPPQWFKDGIEYLLYAPSAFNKQLFIVEGEDHLVSLRSSSRHYGKIETGIGKYHFELGAGKENFTWKD